MVNVHHTLASGELFHAISDILLNMKGRNWSSEFQMVEVKSQVDDIRPKRDWKLPPLSNRFLRWDIFNDLLGEMTVIVKVDSLHLQYGVNTPHSNIRKAIFC